MPDVSGLGDGTPSAHPHLPSSAGLDPIADLLTGLGLCGR
jgi:hypothetical protein